MSEKKFGIYAIDLWVKVTNAHRNAGKLIVVPGQMGFKQRDGSWVNEWIDIILFERLQGNIPKKGERVQVSGRMDCSEYKEKKQWKVFADELKRQGEPERAPEPGPLPDDDVPF